MYVGSANQNPLQSIQPLLLRSLRYYHPMTKKILTSLHFFIFATFAGTSIFQK